jgi:hypothetical protein
VKVPPFWRRRLPVEAYNLILAVPVGLNKKSPPPSEPVAKVVTELVPVKLKYLDRLPVCPDVKKVKFEALPAFINLVINIPDCI